MYHRLIAAVLLGSALPFLGRPVPRAVPCDSGAIAARYADTSTGQRARAFLLPGPKPSRALVAVDPFGPIWAGYLLLTTCDGRTLDSLDTGGVHTIMIRSVTGKRRSEAVVYATASTGSGARTAMISILAVVHDTMHLLWARPYSEYFFGPTWGNQDTAAVTFPRPGWLRYDGTSQAFIRDSVADSFVTDGPLCSFGGLWVWRAKPDSFEPVPPVVESHHCKAA